MVQNGCHWLCIIRPGSNQVAVSGSMPAPPWKTTDLLVPLRRGVRLKKAGLHRSTL